MREMNIYLRGLEMSIIPHHSSQLISIDTDLLREMIASTRRDHDQAARIGKLEKEVGELEGRLESEAELHNKQVADIRETHDDYVKNITERI